MVDIIKDIIIISLLFLIGLFISPYLLSIGLRLPKKKPIGLCFNCLRRYKASEMLPIFPYFLNYQKCPYCGEKISVCYPVLEILLAIIYSFSYILYGLSFEMFILILISSLSLIIYVSDFKYYIIQDIVLFPTIVIVLLLKYIYFGERVLLISLASGIIVFVFMYILKLFGDAISKRESIGGGDIKLSFLFGSILGVRLAVVSLILGAFLAFPVALYYTFAKVNKDIPFGPFLITGLFIVFVFMEPVRSFLMVIFSNY